MSDTNDEQILVDTDDTIRIVTLNRPERLNAWTPSMMSQLAGAVRRANGDDAIEAIVVTGAGRGFCAGADIDAVFRAQAAGDSGDHDDGDGDGRGDGDGDGDDSGSTASGADNWVELVRTSKPIVAAINGAAIGVGLTLALPFDLLVARRDAKLSLRFVKMGVVPELASSRFVPLRCGWGAASELMLTGRTITGDDACEIGLVDRAVDADDVLPTALAAAREMGENPLAIVRRVKELLTLNATEPDLDLVMRRELEALQFAYRSAEHREAIAAFMEKRSPDFRAARASS